jgi:hypothetical protein
MTEATTTEAGLEALEFSPRYYTESAKSAIESAIQVIEEAISNEDEAIRERAEREGVPNTGRIVVSYSPDEMILTVAGDGTGMTCARMRTRLKKVGDTPEAGSKRSYFNRGIRDVFLAMGGGEVTSIGITDDGREVLSKAVFLFDDASLKMRMEIEDEEASDRQRAELGLTGTGTVVAIPVRRLAKRKPKQFLFGPLSQQIRDCVGLRPVLADPDREVVIEYGTTPPQQLAFAYPDAEDLIAEREVEVAGLKGTFWAKLTDKPVKQPRSRRAWIAGILIRGERAAYEVSSGNSLSAYPAMSRVVGELRLDGIEDLQRGATDDSLLVYKTDRSGLNSEHPVVEAAHELIDESLRPLIADLDANRERAKTNSDVRRDLQKLARAINEVIDGTAPDGPENSEGEVAENPETSHDDPEPPSADQPEDRELDAAIEFPVDRAFAYAGESKAIGVWFDATAIAPGSAVEVASPTDEFITRATLSADSVPAPAADGVAELSVVLQAGNSEGRHELTVRSGEHLATLPVHVRFRRSSGFITNIIPEDEDWETGSAIWDPSSGVVKVKVGRPEFKDAAAQARRNGHEDPWKDPSYRQLVVESVREAALWEAAKRAAEEEWDELPAEDRRDWRRFERSCSRRSRGADGGADPESRPRRRTRGEAQAPLAPRLGRQEILGCRAPADPPGGQRCAWRRLDHQWL